MVYNRKEHEIYNTHKGDYDSMERYDIAIIGTGPAGLSAAVTAAIRKKKILLVGSRDLSSKVQKAQEIQNYLGFPDISGAELGKAFEEHIDRMQVPIVEERVNLIYPMGDYFSLQVGQEICEADAVILATGVNFGKPLPGEEEFLGRGVSYCATCDAPLYRGATVAVIAYQKSEETEADFLADIAQKVSYFPMYKEPVEVSEKITVVKEVPKEISGGMKADTLLTKENSYPVDGVFILRESVSPKNLVPGLQMDGNHVAVNLQMETNVPGCFACGDIAGRPYQYIKSAGQGNIAALSAVSFLDQKRRSVVS